MRRTERKARTRARIVEAALEVFARKGYHAATMDEIAQRSRVSKGALYVHFPSKQHLFMTLVDGLADMLIRRMQAAMDRAGQSHHRRMRAAIRSGFRLFEQHRTVVRLVFFKMSSLGPPFDRKLLEIHQRIVRLIQQELEQARAEGSIDLDDTETVAWMWVGAIHEILMRWLLEPRRRSLMADYPIVYRTLLRTIGIDARNDTT